MCRQPQRAPAPPGSEVIPARCQGQAGQLCQQIQGTVCLGLGCSRCVEPSPAPHFPELSLWSTAGMGRSHRLASH